MSLIRCPLFEAATISRHERALATGNQVMLFFELDEMATRVARNLLLLGATPGTRVAIYVENSWQLVAILFGCWRAGVVACPLNTRLPRAAVLEQARHIAAPFLVARVSDPKDESLAGLRIVPPETLLIYRHTAGLEDAGWSLKLDAPATIIFTSGSSGSPKAAEHSVANHYYSARGSSHNVRLSSKDCWLLSLPLYHVGGIGILFRCALAGAALALPESGESLESAQARYGATHISVVPTQLYRLLQSESLPDSFQKLKLILLGGGAAPATLLAEALRRRWPVYPSYGLTEMASQVATMTPSSPPAKRMTSGKVLKHRELRIAEDGEIWVRGDTLFGGYVRGENRDRALNEEGWFPTGDLGALDEEGYLTVHGRKDNLFISGGENIQPEEVENLLASLPEVEEAVVVPRADEVYGARPVAFVRWHGDPLSVAEVQKRLERLLPRYKIPTDVRSFPASETGLKVSRQRLRELAQE